MPVTEILGKGAFDVSEKIEQFLINEGLYGKGLEISTADLEELKLFLQGEYKIEAYCLECESERIFTSEELLDPRGLPLNRRLLYSGGPYEIVPNEEDNDDDDDDGFNELLDIVSQTEFEKLIEMYPKVEKTFTCAKDESHTLTFCCLIKNNFMIKYGQYPSLADLNNTNSKKYRKILGNKYSDFNRGIGLHSHGVGAGSLVYLRRIFEVLIEEAHQKAKSVPGWREENYPSRMDEKIQKLKDYLPVYLVENRKIYGVLSKGIHELSEEMCNKIFPIVRVGIEFILDEKMEKEERERKKKENAGLLDSIAAEIEKESLKA